MTAYLNGHAPGQPLQCLSIGIEIQKEQIVDADGRTACRVGFRVGGGIDQDPTNSPYPDRQIYVSFIEPNSPAQRAGLKQHDRLLQINGIDCTMMTHDRAVKAIQRCTLLKLLIARREVAI